jgi:hypothetical protein
MDGGPFGAIVWVVVLVVFALLVLRRKRGARRYRRAGPGTAGAVYGLLNEDRRKAVEIIVEERAAARDPEDKDGNLPDLEDPRR